MSTLVFVDPEISTQADGAQSSRMPAPFPEDPYEAIRQACLVETDTESEPFKGPVETETPESPHTIASPTSLPDNTPPTCLAEESEDFDMSSARSTSSDSTAPLSPDHPLTHVSPTPTPTRASFHHSTEDVPGTSELILDTDSKGDKLGDKDIEEDDKDESLDADDEGERSDDEGHGSDDEGYSLGNEDHRLDDEGHGLEGEGLGLEEEEEAAREGHQQAVLVVDTPVSEPLGLGYRAARRHALKLIEEITPSTYEVGQSSRTYIDVPAYPPPPPPVQTPPSPEWSSGSLRFSPAPSIVPLPISLPMIPLTVPSPIASPVATPTATISVDEDQFIEIGAHLELYGGILQDHTQRLDAMPHTLFTDIDRDVRELYTGSGVVRDEIFSQRYRFKSLEHEQERTAMTFRALWMPVLALKAWAGRVDTQLADTSRDRYDDYRLIRDMLVQQADMQRELQEMRGCVTTLEQERDRTK
ncbi:hypothetical protein Tco_0471382 [Tanacetum coccineum]